MIAAKDKMVLALLKLDLHIFGQMSKLCINLSGGFREQSFSSLHLQNVFSVSRKLRLEEIQKMHQLNGLK